LTGLALMHIHKDTPDSPLFGTQSIFYPGRQRRIKASYLWWRPSACASLRKNRTNKHLICGSAGLKMPNHAHIFLVGDFFTLLVWRHID